MSDFEPHIPPPRKIVTIVAAEAGWRAVYASKTEDDYFVEIPIACWAMVEEIDVETDAPFRHVVGIVATKITHPADEMPHFLGYKLRGEEQSRWKRIALAYCEREQ